jgi:soluble lytic murein transglycosylase-like protein
MKTFVPILALAAALLAPARAGVAQTYDANGDLRARFNDPAYLRIEQAYMATAKYYNKNLSEAEAQLIARSILYYSHQYGIDPRLVVALIVAESRFNPKAVSPKGAQGLGQLMPGTASYLGVSNAFDIQQNVFGTIKYLREQVDRWRSHADVLDRVLASYNAGPEAVKKHNGVPPYRETKNYVVKVKKLYSYFTTGAQ